MRRYSALYSAADAFQEKSQCIALEINSCHRAGFW
jgi:hypothetical protein